MTVSHPQFPVALALVAVVSFLLNLTPGFADHTSIAGYQPTNEVTQHARLDLDMQAMAAGVDAGNFSEAHYWYATGGNSVKSSGSIRTMQGFSTDAKGKLTGEKWYDIYEKYWNDPAYADTFTSAACMGTGDFAESSNPLITAVSRDECCQKGAQYQNNWMYTIHELEAAIVDCNNKAIGAHWDEAVAFYTGSLPGAVGANQGFFQYTLADKRCSGAGTCVDDNDDDIALYTSKVNARVFELFEQGKAYQFSYQCANLESTKELLVQQFAIPLFQSVNKYLYLADLQETEKERAELWAFAAALLPLIDYYNPSVATVLRENSYIGNSLIVKDGYASVRFSINSVLTSVGITCADVGGLTSTVFPSGYYPGMEPCADSSTTTNTSTGSGDDNGLPDWAIAITVILVFLAAVGICLAVFFYCRTRSLHHRLDEKENLKFDDGVERNDKISRV